MSQINNAFPPVALDKCDKYDVHVLADILKKQFSELGISELDLKGKKVAVKPNLVAPKPPHLAVTTHPAVVEAVYRVIKELGASDIILVESPGGPYTAVTLSHIYKVTEMTETSDRCGLKLNYDLTFRTENFSEGKKLKSFDIITPIADCDVIVNVCKLKTHSLTGMSCAVKNLFGVIPGTMKFEMHAAFSEIDSFSEMLVDLNLTLAQKKTVISVCDAIVSMEGNGPTHGIPVKTDMILSSRSAFALDITAEKLIGMEGETKYLDYGAERLSIPRLISETTVLENATSVKLERPDSKAGSLLRNLPNYFGGSLKRFFEPKPKINKTKCVGCGKCVGYCPQKTITIKKIKGRNIAHISESKCIRCYCCQELCPAGAVDTVKNLILRLVH